MEGLLSFIDLDALANEGHNFFEPCKGSGGIYDFLPDNKAYCCLEENLDYLKEIYPYDSKKVIVTNPPFKLAKEFLEKSLTEAPVVIYFLRLNFLGSSTRFKFFRDNPPDRFIIASDRPSFTPDGNTDSCDYAWFIYDKGNNLGLKQNCYFFEDPVRAEKREARKLKKLSKSM